MFFILKEKYSVNNRRLHLILLSFATAGSTTFILGNSRADFFISQSSACYIIIYTIAIILVRAAAVLITTTVLFGQFNFFLDYLKQMRKRILGKNMANSIDPAHRHAIHLALFASGNGTNAQRIIDHFRFHPYIKVCLLVSNKSDAGALAIAHKEKIPTLVIEREKFFRGNGYVDELRSFNIDLVILAGFLWKLPSDLVAAWNRRIINIHPALLPRHGGKGLYGHHVHEAVIKSGDRETGITIHFVDEMYDHGEHILQEKVLVEEGDTPQSLAKKVQALEHLHFPKVIEKVAASIAK